MNHNFGQEPCRCTDELHTHLSHQDAQEIVKEWYLSHAQVLLGPKAGSVELDELATELMEEME